MGSAGAVQVMMAQQNVAAAQNHHLAHNAAATT